MTIGLSLPPGLPMSGLVGHPVLSEVDYVGVYSWQWREVVDVTVPFFVESGAVREYDCSGQGLRREAQTVLQDPQVLGIHGDENLNWTVGLPKQHEGRVIVPCWSSNQEAVLGQCAKNASLMARDCHRAGKAYLDIVPVPNPHPAEFTITYLERVHARQRLDGLVLDINWWDYGSRFERFLRQVGVFPNVRTSYRDHVAGEVMRLMGWARRHRIPVTVIIGSPSIPRRGATSVTTDGDYLASARQQLTFFRDTIRFRPDGLKVQSWEGSLPSLNTLATIVGWCRAYGLR